MIPDYQDLTKLMQVGNTAHLTAVKTMSIIDRDKARITGFVLTGKYGYSTIVNSSAVRWLSKKDMRELMHGKEAE